MPSKKKIDPDGCIRRVRTKKLTEAPHLVEWTLLLDTDVTRKICYRASRWALPVQVVFSRALARELESPLQPVRED